MVKLVLTCQLGALRCHAVFRRSVCTFGNLIVALLQLWVGWPKFLTCEKLFDRPKAILYIQPVHCTGSGAWQNGNSAQLQNELWHVKFRAKNGLKPDSVCPAEVKCPVFPLAVGRYFFARVTCHFIFRRTSATATSQQAIQQEKRREKTADSISQLIIWL